MKALIIFTIITISALLISTAAYRTYQQVLKLQAYQSQALERALLGK